VDCSRCGRSNPGHVRYCLDCGSNLAPAPTPSSAPRPPDNLCTNCETKNPLDARFCRECGALLGAASEPQSSDPSSPHPYTPAPYASHLLDVDAPPPAPMPSERRPYRASQAPAHTHIVAAGTRPPPLSSANSAAPRSKAARPGPSEVPNRRVPNWSSNPKPSLSSSPRMGRPDAGTPCKAATS
jgi:ribosomal protein L40E